MQYKSLYAMLKAFPNEEACVKHLEQLRWPNGIICPCCGSSRKIYRLKRGHTFKCADCQNTFSVRKGTIFEESKLELRKWFAAAWLITSHRKGISSLQLSRELGVTQKTAWFMLGRLREVAAAMGSVGGPVSGTVEADESYFGGKEKNKHASKRRNRGRGAVGKQIVMGVIERGGKVRAKMIRHPNRHEMQAFIRDNIAAGSTIYTDEHRAFLGLDGYNHESVNHSVGEYVRDKAHINGIESFWALLKRGYIGTFHQFSWKHLHRYLHEFSTRWNMTGLKEDDRLNSLLESVAGCRLTYKRLIA